MRVLTFAYAILWTYAGILAYLGTATVLKHEAQIYLPLSDIATMMDLFPFIFLGVLGTIILNFYRAHLKKPIQRVEESSA